MLELNDVRVRYRGRERDSLAALSLQFNAAQPKIVAVVGESGSGKTTLAQIALGLRTPSSGSVRYEGTDLERLSGKQRLQFRRAVQAILQDPFSSFNPFYKVDKALSLPLARFGLAKSGAEALALMRHACEQVGLNPDDTLGRFPHQLSGGQRQRLMVARALMLKPQLIIADEPVSMVDASLRASILDNVASLRHHHGISVLYITHDLTTAFHVADAVMVLYQGEVVEAGDVATVLGQPRHPYTQLLMDSIPMPSLDTTWGRIPLKATEQPVAPGGCAFAHRCWLADDDCRQHQARLVPVSTAHVVACLKASPTRSTTELATVPVRWALPV